MKQGCDCAPVGGVATQNLVLATDPEISRLPHRDGGRLRGLLLARIQAGGTEEGVELGGVEAERDEIDAEVFEVADLEREQLAIPASLLGELVVGDDVGTLLRLGEVRKLDHGDRVEAELLRRLEPAVARDDAALSVDEDRAGEAELA